MFDFKTIDLGKVNSATKYPSIPTYHSLDPKNGSLKEETVKMEGDVIVTEKVDGTNARIIFFPGGDFIIGSREELLYAKGDLIGNPALGIVEKLKGIALQLDVASKDEIVVFYGEVYGGKVTAASKQYTTKKEVGYRLFDIMRIKSFKDTLEMTRVQISGWRENGGQTFVPEAELQEMANAHGMETTPRLDTVKAGSFPDTIEETYGFLKEIMPESRCCLDSEAKGKPEGIVVRNSSRETIAKIRFQDYERTMRKRKS